MRKLAFLLALIIVLLSFGGCVQTEKQIRSFYLMDTLVSVTLYTEDQEAAEEIFAECKRLLSELDALWARQKEGSDVSRFNASESGIEDLDPRTITLLQKALLADQNTGGAFDMTLAPVSDLWTLCGEENRLPTDTELSDLLSHTGSDKLSLDGTSLKKTDEALQIDLGGIGKGEAISLLMQYLTTTSVTGALVSFGSNVAVLGEKPDGKPYRIALRDPKDVNGTVGQLRMAEGEILSVSGDYERYVTVDGEQYHHVLNPKDGYPAKSGLSSVAVVARDGAIADALSTAFLVMGKEATLSFYEAGVYSFEAILVTSEGEIYTTAGLADQFDPAD